MEMKEIDTGGEAGNDLLEAKPQDPLEGDYHYSRLKKPSEDIYSEAFFSPASQKQPADKRAERNLRLYRAACVVLLVISLILLVAVIALSVQRLPCLHCPRGWLLFGRSCFYLSTSRLSWDESQKNCSSVGGSLVIITDQTVQNFLTEQGKLQYWMGLSYRGTSWTWVNNTVLGQSYWKEPPSAEGCGLLMSQNPREKNWISIPCQDYAYFICQLQLRPPFSSP
ncbi:perlucin-like protein [Lampetra planeri]